MEIKCIPRKILFNNYEKNFKIISCQPTELVEGIILNEYGCFSIQGNNLDNLALNVEIVIWIEPTYNSKYPYSYKYMGYGGLELRDKVIIPPEAEKMIMCQFMEESQAVSCLEVYPEFVQMVIDGREDEIDVKKIKGVGEKLKAKYIKKIRESLSSLALFPTALKYGIADPSDIDKIAKKYFYPEHLAESINENPYSVYRQLNWSFEKIEKAVNEIFPQFLDTDIRCSFVIEYILELNEKEGNTRIDLNLLKACVSELAPVIVKRIDNCITNNNDFIYDSKTKKVSKSETYYAEQNIKQNILVRKNFTNKNNLLWENYTEVDGFVLTEEQQQVLKLANNNHIMILSGPGGSGKSSSTRAFVRMLEGNYCSYHLLAPTGIASRRLAECTGRNAQTIHMYLNNDKSTAEWFIIDEASMISVNLLSDLLSTIGYEPNILLICDEAQLASIDCGNIVHDIIKANIIPVIKLTKIFRYNTSGIITLATDARHGTFEHCNNSYPDFTYKELTQDDATSFVLDTYFQYLKSGYEVGDILILTPYNILKTGALAINNILQNELNKNPSLDVKITVGKAKIDFKKGDKILNIKNNYSPKLLDFTEDDDIIEVENVAGSTNAIYNGDIGWIRDLKIEDDKPNMIVDFNDTLYSFKMEDISNLRLGYCENIYKCQGQEAKVVIVVIAPEHRKNLNRNVLYVAFSRAKEQLCVIGDRKTIEAGMQVVQNEERDTWLFDLLTE